MSKYSEKLKNRIEIVDKPVEETKQYTPPYKIKYDPQMVDAKISFYTKYLQEFAFELKKLQKIKQNHEVEIHRDDAWRAYLNKQIQESNKKMSAEVIK